ncbi:hypothetical protein AEAC466_12195 [Asticcacaulis sp. AC466]|uniref:hypothetical protein n=1 Tax=Asticcacaulis sp. AC466 TaxID=1282362 RepID=UPI0003C406F2|nr:hypothetical protein [Asticcacaulis sp. AC466]ESQ83429.1 hypothetical protein AEAC466_12195 [Asticcacaulis sp. AC466]
MKQMPLIAVLSLCFALSACAQTPPHVEAGPVGSRLAITDDLQCRILADLGQALSADNFDPQVDGEGGKIDCTTAFRSAGLPMTGSEERSVRFGAPQFTGDDEAFVRTDFVCRRLCGHGEMITLHLDGGRWTIANRKTTWMS